MSDLLAGQVFTARWKTGRARVLGGIWIGVCAGLGLVMALNGVLPLAPLVAGVAGTAWLWPALTGAAALEASSEGLRLDGAAVIPWRSIARVRVEAPMQGAALLTLELAGEAPSAHPFVLRATRRKDARVLVVVLAALDDPPEDIAAAIELFWGRPVALIRGMLA